jgi:hypothetical protein
MVNIKTTLRVFALLTFTLALSAIAQAQATRTWVSGVGDDVNPCSRTAPCKTFAGAISKTAVSGEIDCLDPGGFGTVTITKSITIDGTTGAGFGGILSAGTSGIIANDIASATPHTSEVILRHLSIDGAGTGTFGVRALSYKSVTIDGCQIFAINGATGRGVDISDTVDNDSVFVKNTDIEDCSGAGIFATTTVGKVNVQVEGSTIRRCATGIDMSTGGRLVARNSRITQNNGIGIRTAGSTLSINFIDSCSIDSNTSDGIQVGASTIVRISNNLITLNLGIGLNNTAVGTVTTFSDNRIFGNATETSGPAPTPQGKS